jgi:hypothetical protein
MFPLGFELIANERMKELQREAEHWRLINSFKRQQPAEKDWWRKAAGALGQQMVVMGTKLQAASLPAQPECC